MSCSHGSELRWGTSPRAWTVSREAAVWAVEHQRDRNAQLRRAQTLSVDDCSLRCSKLIQQSSALEQFVDVWLAEIPWGQCTAHPKNSAIKIRGLLGQRSPACAQSHEQKKHRIALLLHRDCDYLWLRLLSWYFVCHSHIDFSRCARKHIYLKSDLLQEAWANAYAPCACLCDTFACNAGKYVATSGMKWSCPQRLWRCICFHFSWLGGSWSVLRQHSWLACMH